MIHKCYGRATANLEALKTTLNELIEDWPRAVTGSSKRCDFIVSEVQQLVTSSSISSDIQDVKFQGEDNVTAPQPQMLLDILDQLQSELQTDASVMVFTTTRACALTLAEVINGQFRRNQNELPRSEQGFHPKADYIIGGSILARC